MDLEDAFLEAAEPLHLQQLRCIADELQAAQQQSDSVTWVPETIPTFVQQAVQNAVIATAEGTAPAVQQLSNNGATATANTSQGPEETVVAQPQSTESTTATGPAVIIGSQHFKSAATNKRTSSASYVITTCLVPDGMPAAAAAEAGGGLACLEVECRVLVLQDNCPAAATPGLAKALSKVKWQEFGLSFSDFTASSNEADLTGILTLGVLPHAVVAPLNMVVCSTNSIVTNTTDILLGVHGDADQVIESSSSSNSSHRGRGGSNSSSSTKAPPLSCKRECLLFQGAFEDALSALKAALPPGYLHSKLESCMATCLPAIAASITNILSRAYQPQLCLQACDLLTCEPQQLKDSLLQKLQTAASVALTTKTSVGSARLQKQLQQQQHWRRKEGVSDSRAGGRAAAAAAAAAAIAAGAGDGLTAVGSDAQHDDSEPQQQPQQQQQQLRQQQQLLNSRASSGFIESPQGEFSRGGFVPMHGTQLASRSLMSQKTTDKPPAAAAAEVEPIVRLWPAAVADAQLTQQTTGMDDELLQLNDHGHDIWRIQQPQQQQQQQRGWELDENPLLLLLQQQQQHVQQQQQQQQHVQQQQPDDDTAAVAQEHSSFSAGAGWFSRKRNRDATAAAAGQVTQMADGRPCLQSAAVAVNGMHCHADVLWACEQPEAPCRRRFSGSAAASLF